MKPSLALWLLLLSGCAGALDDETSALDDAADLGEHAQALTPCADGSSCLPGTYAVRSVRFSKARSGSTVDGKKTVDYALVTIARTWFGSLRFTEKLCYSESAQLSSNALYEWSKPSWLSALPAVTTSLTRNANGTFTRATQVAAQGWSALRQPSTCTATASPMAPWPSTWGTTCRCNAPASSLPPFSRTLPYDCRALDADLDGYPGWSRFAALTPPVTPESNAGGVAWARLMQATSKQETWTIRPSGDGRHEATLADNSPTSIIGCAGGGLVNPCAQLTGNPLVRTCPQSFNKALFLPATSSSDTCAEIVAARSVLFSSGGDGSLPDNAVCPPP